MESWVEGDAMGDTYAQRDVQDPFVNGQPNRPHDGPASKYTSDMATAPVLVDISGDGLC